MIFLANPVSVVLHNNPWIIQYCLDVNIQFLLSMSWSKIKKQNKTAAIKAKANPTEFVFEHSDSMEAF